LGLQKWFKATLIFEKMKSNVILYCVGKTGVGKSYFLNYVLHKEIEKKRREGIVILDLRSDHVDLLQEGFALCQVSHEMMSRLNIDWAGYLNTYKNVVVVPYKLSMEEYGDLADDLAGGVIDNGNRIFVLEEAGHGLPVYSSNHRNLSVLTTTGRGLGIDFFFTSQRPAQVNTTAVSEANVRVCFQLDEMNDIRRMKNIFPTDNIESLKRFEFIALNTFNHEKVRSDTYHLEAVDKIIWSDVL
jgi:GTPase SAR1 family protein